MDEPESIPSQPYYPPLVDEQGPIPTFRAKTDEKGRLIPQTPEERHARREAWERLVRLRATQPLEEEPPGLDEEIMRGIDSYRPEGSKLFEGYY